MFVYARVSVCVRERDVEKVCEGDSQEEYEVWCISLLNTVRYSQRKEGKSSR